MVGSSLKIVPEVVSRSKFGNCSGLRLRFKNSTLDEREAARLYLYHILYIPCITNLRSCFSTPAEFLCLMITQVASWSAARHTVPLLSLFKL